MIISLLISYLNNFLNFSIFELKYTSRIFQLTFNFLPCHRLFLQICLKHFQTSRFARNTSRSVENEIGWSMAAHSNSDLYFHTSVFITLFSYLYPIISERTSGFGTFNSITVHWTLCHWLIRTSFPFLYILYYSLLLPYSSYYLLRSLYLLLSYFTVILMHWTTLFNC